MVSSHSMYKHPSKIANAKPIDKAVSKFERKVRQKKIQIFKLLNRLTVIKEQHMHQNEIIRIIRSKDEKFFQKCLKEKDNLFGKTRKAKEIRIEHMKNNYKAGGESTITGWIGRQIEKEENGVLHRNHAEVGK